MNMRLEKKAVGAGVHFTILHPLALISRILVLGINRLFLIMGVT